MFCPISNSILKIPCAPIEPSKRFFVFLSLLHLVLWISGEGGEKFHIFTNTIIISVKVAAKVTMVRGWTCRFFSVAVVWDNGKKVPWRRLKLCGCTISFKFSISYDIWKFFIHSHFLSSVYLSLMIHYGRMWVFHTNNILHMSVQTMVCTVYHYCPILHF